MLRGRAGPTSQVAFRWSCHGYTTDSPVVALARLIGFQQPDRDRQEGRLLRWREELDRSDIAQFRWTLYDVHELQAIIPDWIRFHLEIYTWRSAVPVVCFNMGFSGTQEYFTWYVAAVGVGRFLSQGRRLDDPCWMFAPPDLPFTTTHPRDDLAMPEEAPARRRRAAAVGTGRRPPANADPRRPPVNARDRRRRERMGVRVGGEEAREEADLFARYEDEGNDGDQPHISPERSQRGNPDIIGSSSMMPPMHASHPAGSGAPHTSPSAASPAPSSMRR
ncbi:hypothetical protein PIB30_032655 [Stylosanthes scabra]|uniref:Aminotransferase-like plant mobile domain-containing protein n=1 Tax=Stylosanthes scabra TaxID=79078 RepID=A0ABU6XAE1_9FABA|nr:hypothetical protein [Stylosanthes scabra]